MPSDHAPGQRLAHAIQFLDSDRILETRQGLVTMPGRALLRDPDREAAYEWAAGQSRRVVGVRVATSNREHALRD